MSYRTLDRFRLFAAFLIVAIHTYPLTSISLELNFLFTHIFARIAVPFFLMVTGYFVLSKNTFPTKFIRRTTFIYIGATLLYLPISIYAGHYAVGFSDEYIKTQSYINVALTFLKNLVFDGTFYHLWYLPAVIIGVLLVYVLLRYFAKRIVVGIALILYVIGLFGDSYYGLVMQVPFLESMYELIFGVSSYTRNGIFYAPLFLVMGVNMANKIPLPGRGEFGFIISLTFMLMEGSLLNHFHLPRHDSLYITLIPTMYFLFQYLLYKDIQNTNRNTSPPHFTSLREPLAQARGSSHNLTMLFSLNLRKIAMWIFILHPLFIIAIRGIARFTGLTSFLVDNSIIHYIVVCLFTFIASIILSYCQSVISRNSATKQSSHPIYPPTTNQPHLHKRIPHRAWIELNFENLRHNINILKSHLPPDCQLMPAVKANAYGHGAVPIARELNACGIYSFCVVSVAEAVELRKNHIKGEILILGYTPPEHFQLLRRYHLTQTVLNHKYAVLLNEESKKRLPVHIKVDTGMRRMGERSKNLKEILNIFKYPNLDITGIYTHLCVADSVKMNDINFTQNQIKNFNEVLNYLKENGITPPKTHVHSSYGVLRDLKNPYDYARIGIALYGTLSNSNDTMKWGSDLRPVLSVKARVAMTAPLYAGEATGYGLTFTAPHDMKIAVISIGYADGIPRSLSNGIGFVLINGSKAPIVGRICMDSLTVDITEIENVNVGDIAIIIGASFENPVKKCIANKITVNDLADQAGTITNEILSRLGARLEVSSELICIQRANL